MKGKELGISVIIALMMVVFVLYQYDFFDRFKKSSANGDEITRNTLKNHIKANSEHPDKEKLLLKMMDSIDYFKDLEGEYEEYNRFVNEVTNVKYAIDVNDKNGIGAYSTNHILDNTVIFLGSENKKIDFDEKAHTYRVFKWIPQPKNEEVSKFSATERIYGNNRVDDEFAGMASHVVDSELTNYLINYNDWDYKEVTFLGLPSYKLTGVIDKQLSSNMDGKFDLIVEKNAGLVLGFHVYDEKGKVKFSLTTKSIKIDKGLDNQVFEKDLSKYKEIKKK